jgi:hypothetical protein
VLSIYVLGGFGGVYVYHPAANHLETRYDRYVCHCPNTRKALGRVRALKRSMMALAVASITLSCGMASSQQVSQSVILKMLQFIIPLIPLSSFAGAGLYRLEQCLIVSFKRKEQ